MTPGAANRNVVTELLAARNRPLVVAAKDAH